MPLSPQQLYMQLGALGLPAGFNASMLSMQQELILAAMAQQPPMFFHPDAQAQAGLHSSGPEARQLTPAPSPGRSASL
jgi:hypothetical protein